MGPVFRRIGAVVAGFIVASIVMMIVESINGRVLHPELGRAAEGVMDREVLRGLLAAAPMSAFLVVILGWILGAIAGGWVAVRLAGPGIGPGLVIGVLLTLAGIANNLMIPPPTWFLVVSPLVMIPSAWFGARLVRAR